MTKPCGYAFEAVTIVLSNHNGQSEPGPKVAMCVCGYFAPPHDLQYIRGDLNTETVFFAMNAIELQKARLMQLKYGMGFLPVCREVCDCQKPLSSTYKKGRDLQMMNV